MRLVAGGAVWAAFLVGGLPLALAEPELPQGLVRAQGAVLEVDALDAQGNVMRTATGFLAGDRRTVLTTRSSTDGATRVVIVGSDGRQRDVEPGSGGGFGNDLMQLRLTGGETLQTDPLPVAGARLPRPRETVFILGRTSGLPGMDAAAPVAGVVEGGSLLRMSAAVGPSANGSPVVDAAGNLLGVAEIGAERDSWVCRLLTLADVTPPSRAAEPAPLASARDFGSGPEPSPPRTRSVEEGRLLAFVQAFVRSWNSGEAVPEAAFYAERVRYYGREMSRAAVAADTGAYNRRWPKRDFHLVAEPFLEGGNPAHARVSVAFTVENATRRVVGQASYGMELVPVADSFGVVAMEEDITRKASQPVIAR